MAVDFSSIRFASDSVVVGQQSYSFKKTGFLNGKRAYLTTEGTVKTLNIIQRFLRFFFGAYKKTHAKKVWNALTANKMIKENRPFPKKKEFRQTVRSVIEIAQDPTNSLPKRANPPNPTQTPNPPIPIPIPIPTPTPNSNSPTPGPSAPPPPTLIVGVAEENKRDIPFEEFQTGFTKFLEKADICNMPEEGIQTIYEIIQQKKNGWFSEVQEREEGKLIKRGKRYLLGEIGESYWLRSAYKLRAMVTADGEIILLLGGRKKPTITDEPFNKSKVQRGYSYQRKTRVAYRSYKAPSEKEKEKIAYGIAYEQNICSKIHSKKPVEGLLPEIHHSIQYQGNVNNKLCEKKAWIQKEYEGSLEIFSRTVASTRPKDWSFQEKVQVVRNACEGLRYLHQQGIFITRQKENEIHVLFDENRNGTISGSHIWSEKNSSSAQVDADFVRDILQFGRLLENVFMEILLPFNGVLGGDKVVVSGKRILLNHEGKDEKKSERVEVQKNNFNKELYKIVCQAKDKPTNRATADELYDMLKELEQLIPEDEKGSKKVEPPKQASTSASPTLSFDPAQSAS